MAIRFEVKGTEEVLDMRKFCRLSGKLTYVGEVANKKTSLVIRGTIIMYDGKFYTTDLDGMGGVCTVCEGALWKTSISLFELKEYVPEEYKPVNDCPIRIDVWDTKIDDEGPISSYAFYDGQLEVAKELVNNNRDVDIFLCGELIGRRDFMEG